MMRRLLERFWFSPVLLVVSALLWWVQGAAEWDPWRVLAPVLGVMAVVGVLRLGRVERRRSWVVTVAVGCALIALMLDDEGATAALTPARDAVLIAGVMSLSVAVLWARGVFTPGAARGAVFEAGVLASAVFAVTVLVLDASCRGLNALELGLIVVFAVMNAVAVGLVVVLLLAEGSRNASALLVAVGLLVAMATSVWHLRLSLENGDETWLSWMFVLGFAVAVSGVWHPSVVRLRDTLGGSSRPVLSVVAVSAAVWCGAAVLLFGESSLLTIAAGVVCGVSAIARAVTAARSGWLDREDSAVALVRGALVRDDERAQLKRLLHDDVLQPIVVASWLTRSDEARAALEDLEERTRHVLNTLEPRIPQTSEIGALLEGLFRETRAKRITVDARSTDTGEGTIDVMVEGVETEGANGPVRVPLWFVASSTVAAAASAGASSVDVRISFEGDLVRMVVFDDAVGDAARRVRNEQLLPVRDRVNDGAGEMLIGETTEGAGHVEVELQNRDISLRQTRSWWSFVRRQAEASETATL